MKAYVLINTQTSQTAEVVHVMRKMKGVIAADVTFGPYDIAAIVESPELATLSQIIVREMRSLPGVIDTIKCLVVESA